MERIFLEKRELSKNGGVTTNQLLMIAHSREYFTQSYTGFPKYDVSETIDFRAWDIRQIYVFFLPYNI